jgi:gluconolactonase
VTWDFHRVAGPYGSPTDGPVWDGGALLFTQLTFPFNAANNRILRYDQPTGAVTDFRRWTNRTMGLAFSRSGELYGAQSGGRRLVQFNADESTSPLAHKLGGVYHNQPKDLVVDSRDRIWFCDPHGDLREAMNPQIHDKLDHASVLRLEAPTLDAPITRVTYDTDAPMALLLSVDESTLYVAESSEEPNGPRELRAYPILNTGALGPYRLLHSFGRDGGGMDRIHRGIYGMCLDREGNILAVAGGDGGGPGPMLYVITPEGRVLRSHALPEEPTNCAFGGHGLGDLFVTTTAGSLLRASGIGHVGL